MEEDEGHQDRQDDFEHMLALRWPAMAGSVGRAAQGERSARTVTDTPRMPSSTPTLLGEKGRSGPFNFSLARPFDSPVPLSHSLPLARSLTGKYSPMP